MVFQKYSHKAKDRAFPLKEGEGDIGGCRTIKFYVKTLRNTREKEPDS